VTASTELLIGDIDGQRVLVRAQARHHPDLFDATSENQISSDVEIVAGGMRAAYRAELRSEDFQSFLEEAEAFSRSGDGVATFSTVEGQLTVSLTAAEAGRVRVTGEALDASEGGNRLEFAFEIDQSALPEICRSLEVLLSAFPVVGTAEA
jgi:hypothetical protein